MKSQRGQVSPTVMLIAVAAGALYYAGEGIVKADRWVVNKAKHGIAKVFHHRKATAVPAIPAQPVPIPQVEAPTK